MEFVGNRINSKTILATLILAFLIGRVELFGGTFPAAIALITVMVAVSTVYIYLVPVLLAAMMTVANTGASCVGDMLSIIVCGIVFLFFHNSKFTINQRTAIAIALEVGCNVAYFSWSQIIYLFDFQSVVAEAVTIVILIRVFNTIARTVFVGPNSEQVSEEKIMLAYAVLFALISGSAGQQQITFALCLAMAVMIQYCRGIQWAMTEMALVAIYWQFAGYENVEIFVSGFAGLMAGWFLAILTDGKYRKTILCLGVFAAVAIGGTIFTYAAAAAMAALVAIPSSTLVHLWCMAKDRLCPDMKGAADVKLDNIKSDLNRKRETFDSLAKLYGSGMDKGQIISYQFEGMSRCVQRIIKDIEMAENTSMEEKPAPTFTVGSASYAFDMVSGDSSISFNFGRDKQALIISDGMGKGSKAAAESKLVVTTLSKLLTAGFDVDVAIKTINAILLTSSNTEIFATVDLAIIDRKTNKVQIFKMGAASTFVKHNGKVHRLKRAALPAGVTDGLKLEYIDVRLKRGDMIIMVSDGVTDCDRKDPDGNWLVNRLEEISTRDPSTIAELVVNKSAEKYQLRERDDLTVMVAACGA